MRTTAATTLAAAAAASTTRAVIAGGSGVTRAPTTPRAARARRAAPPPPRPAWRRRSLGRSPCTRRSRPSRSVFGMARVTEYDLTSPPLRCNNGHQACRSFQGHTRARGAGRSARGGAARRARGADEVRHETWHGVGSMHLIDIVPPDSFALVDAVVRRVAAFPRRGFILHSLAATLATTARRPRAAEWCVG